MDVEDLTRGAVPNFEFRSLTPLLNDDSPYYEKFLDNVSIGYIPSREIDRYFDFIEHIYFPLGNDRLEKYLYDGLALLVGFLPKIYVPNYEALVREHRFEILLQRSALWIERTALLVIPGFLLHGAIRRFRLAPRRSLDP